MSTIPRHIGKYELLQQLGRGSAGEVWKGHNPVVHQDVAIKLLYPDLQSDPNFMTQFAQQGHLLTSLHYPNLVQVREVNISRPLEGNETTAYIVMDYIDGPTLANYIKTTSHKGIFPSPQQITYLFTSVSAAIDYGHQRGFVHGNIKPENILLARLNTKRFEGGEPQLSDFGIAQLLGSAAGISSPLYISPEQAKGHHVTSQSDIYSLGVILYEICTGTQPFRDESAVAVMMQHINTLPTPPNLINSNIPVKLSEVILRAMSKDPDARYSKASLLATAIADAFSLQSTFNISSNGLAAESEEATYSTNASAGSILGVSQPVQRVPLRAPTSQPLPMIPFRAPIAQPLPQAPLHARISQPLPPLPRVSGPLTDVSGKYPAIQGGPKMPAPPLYPMGLTLSGRMPAASFTNSANADFPTSTLSNKITMPPPLPRATPTPLPLIASRARQKRTRFIDTPIFLACIGLLLLLLVLVTALGADKLITSRQPITTTIKATAMNGHAFFLDDTLGHNDQIRIEMQNVPSPANGKSYFAWFQNTNNQMQLLGPLTLQNGMISYTYQGDSTHSNLLTRIQSFFITQENSGSTPKTPSNQTVYQARFDTNIVPALKNILYSTPGLPNNQSVVANLLDTIKSLNDKVGSINDSLQVQPDLGLVRRQATRVIESIDGTNYAMKSGDLPTKYRPLEGVSIGLLSSPRQQGYLDILATQLNAFKQAAHGNQTQLAHAQNVENALADLRIWVKQMRNYDVTILKATILTTPTIVRTALQLKNTAVNSYVGRTIPPDPAPKPILGSAGAYQAYIEAQYMAELDFEHV